MNTPDRYKRVLAELREAADKMRQLATEANTDKARTPYSSIRLDPVPENQWGQLVGNYLGGEVGAHCAAWTPTVALTVAAWLESGISEYTCVDRQPMRTVALAFLGRAESSTARLVAQARSVEQRQNSLRCSSCDHRIGFHQPDGCWFTAAEGRVDAVLNCPCSLSREQVEQASEAVRHA